MKLTYAAPPTDLTPYITAFYLFELGREEIDDIERADIAQMRLFLEGSGELEFAGGVRFSNSNASLIAPRTRASRIIARGPMRVFGVGLLPAGWAAVTGLPADEHVNTVLDARSVMGEDATDFLERLRGAASLDEMAEIAIGVARTFYESAEAVPHWFIREVDAWLGTRLSPEIADLETSTGLSRRQIERHCKTLYGAAPKLLVRKYRALRTANAIACGKGDWQDFIDEGYYDQSHCIREIKEFIGITPSAVRDHVSPLTAITRDRSALMPQMLPTTEKR